jgi:hypothetical protein
MGRKGKKEMLGGFFCFIGEEGGGDEKEDHGSRGERDKR